jgi:hypothetical protein
MRVGQAAVEPSHLTLGALQVWSAGLIKMLEWRVFGRMPVAYSVQQEHKILGIKMGVLST